MVEHIKVYDDLILVTLPKTESSAKRTFTVTGKFFSIVHKYIRLRPVNATINRFFLHYRDESCSLTPIGRNKFFEMARRVAKYLKLPSPELYTANSFRINPTNTATGNTIAWESSNNAPEQPDQCSLDYETGLLRTSSVIYSRPSASAPNQHTNENRNGHRNGNKTTTGTDGKFIYSLPFLWWWKLL